MKIRTTIAAAGTATVLGITGAILLPAAASAHTVTHTLTFTSVAQGQTKFSATSTGFEDKDLSKAGKVSAWVTVDTAGGFLSGTLKVTSNPVTHGTVTGGTGAFAGATGTITAKTISATKLAVTIIYQT